MFDRHRATMLLAAGVLLFGCATGPRYADVASSIPHLDPAKSRVVIFREAHFVGSGVDARIKIDGKKYGSVENGSMLIIDVLPSDVKVSLDSAADMFDGMDFGLRLEAGQTYYIEIRSTSADYVQNMGGALPYFVGSLRAQGVMQFCGPGWCAQQRDEAEALPKLSDLTVVKKNSVVQGE